jgi:hypothetical protein
LYAREDKIRSSQNGPWLEETISERKKRISRFHLTEITEISFPVRFRYNRFRFAAAVEGF